MGGTVRCACGRVHQTIAALRKCGWMADGTGNAFLLVDCDVCGSTITAAVARDASICSTCRRLVVGTDGDVKICLVDCSQGSLVLCVACARRSDHAIAAPIRRAGGWR